MNFFVARTVQTIVSSKSDKNETTETLSRKVVRETAPSHISFDTRRSTARAGRRLFIPQKQLMLSVFAPQMERPRAILRVVSAA